MNEYISPERRPCPECGQQRVWGSFSGYSNIIVKRDDAWFGGTALLPLVCTGCGLTIFYHPEPAKMRAEE